MGVSTRPRTRPRPSRPRSTPLERAQKKTIKAALDARAHGLLTEVGLDHVADGKVDSRDLKRAEKILDKAEELLSSIECEPEASRTQVRIAEERVDVAQALVDAVGDQLSTQKGNRTPRSRK
jgi:hypothetical protein